MAKAFIVDHTEENPGQFFFSVDPPVSLR